MPVKEAPTEVQIFRVRQGTRTKCRHCQETIRKGQYVARVDGQYEHQNCAGVEGDLEKCTNCFMIVSSCICGF